MKAALRNKLRCKRGLTMTEMLVALAILALVAIAVSMGISSSTAVYRSAVTTSESSVLTSTLTQALTDELRFAKDIKTVSASDNTLQSYTSTLYGTNAAISVVSDASSPNYGQVMVSGTYPLIGSGAYTSFGTKLDIRYENGLFHITITAEQDSSDILQTELMVRAVNS